MIVGYEVVTDGTVEFAMHYSNIHRKALQGCQIKWQISCDMTFILQTMYE